MDNLLAHPARPASRRPSRRSGALGLLGCLLLVLGGAALRPLTLGRTVDRVRLTLAGAHPVRAPGLLLQEGLADCGPTALHNLLAALGAPSPGPAALGRLSDAGPDGVTLGGLVRAAAAVGVPLRARRLSGPGLAAVRAPFLAWVRPHHFVTVLAVDAGEELTVHDPVTGAYRVSLQAFRRRWGGVVADLAPGGQSSADTRPVLLLPAPHTGPGVLPPSDRRHP